MHLLATGGTISIGSSGSLSAAELTKLDPAIAGVADVTVEDFVSIGSSSMTPEIQLGIAQRINAIFKDRPELAGIVVTHGTDSLEETAFFVDLLLKDDRPVVFTGAMRPPRNIDTDGPRNLLNAIRVSAAEGARGLGVVVTLNDEIHAARDVRKVHTSSTNAFASPGLGPLGYVDGDAIYLAHKPARRLQLDADAVEPRVTLVHLFAGSDGSQVRSAVAAGQRGIVIEVFGRGNAPPKVMTAVREARDDGVIVVFAPRTGGGRIVLGEDAERIGVISAEDLDGLQARLVLVASLATTRDLPTLQSYYRRLSGKLGAQ